MTSQQQLTYISESRRIEIKAKREFSCYKLYIPIESRDKALGVLLSKKKFNCRLEVRRNQENLMEFLDSRDFTVTESLLLLDFDI